VTIFLHIGRGKTGTTSIQTFLEANGPALAERGIVTPTTLARRNHRRLTMYALNDDVVDNLRRAKRMTTPQSVQRFRERLAESFVAEAKTWQPDQAIVMTSEQMTRLRTAEEIARLKGLLDLAGHGDIRVIVYLRRQDLAQVSTYSQLVKGGSSAPFQPAPPGEGTSQLFYDAFLAPWADVFGTRAIVVRPFESCSLKNGDAIDDFMSVVGLDDLTGLVRPPRGNASLDVYTLEFLRRLNPQLPRWLENNKQDRSRDALIAVLESISDGPKLRMSPEATERFMAPFRAGNALVARTYLGQDELFREGFSDEPPVEPGLPAEAALRIVRALFTRAIVPALELDDIISVTARLWNNSTPPQNPA
jgi:hypothetical protein